MKILVVGGYGTFGGRLVDLLKDDSRLTLLVVGRNLAAAEDFCVVRQGSSAMLVPLVFDRGNPQGILVSHRPDLVVDSSGPFQGYAGDPYVLPRACIEAGCNYLDLADGAAFVEGIGDLHEAARSAGVFVLSGMSSFPVLTAAVCRVLAKDMDQVRSIEAGIAPSPYAGVGLNVIKAIASYAGKPVQVLHDRAWEHRTGFFDSRHLQVNVPGHVPLPVIRFALAEVPDLKVLKWQHPEAKSIWMGAGPTPAALHRLLWLAAGLVKFRLLPSLLPLARVMNFVVNTVRWGEHRGGLVLEMKGEAHGKDRAVSWHLLAEGEGGPFIPSMAAAAIVVGMLDGKVPRAGARPGHGDLELTDYEPWFLRYGIQTGTRLDGDQQGTMYQRILGEAFGRLAPVLQDFHAARGVLKMRGEAEDSGSNNLIAMMVRKIFGLPQAQQNCPVEVEIASTNSDETWLRCFAGKPMQSYQLEGRGADAGLIVERFGPLSFAMAVTEQEGRMNLVLRHWRILGLRLPKVLMPRGTFFEHGANNRFNFHVEIVLPFLGRLVCYKGWLVPI